jgi:hypothetical protein
MIDLISGIINLIDLVAKLIKLCDSRNPEDEWRRKALPLVNLYAVAECTAKTL